MSAADAKAFLDRLESEEALAEELSGLRDDPAAVQARVRELGFDASTEEVRAAFLERYGAVLDEEQLSALAGGLTDSEANIVGGVLGGVAALGIFAGAAAAAAF